MSLLRVKDVARMLNVSESWVYDHLDQIPHVRLGVLVRFDEKTVRDFFLSKSTIPLGDSVISPQEGDRRVQTQDRRGRRPAARPRGPHPGSRG